MSILLITTGGTIGALPYPDLANPPKITSMPPDDRDLVRETLAPSFKSLKVRCVSLPPRDSNQIDEDYRNMIVRTIEEAPEGKIVITHGTDTLLETAEFLHQQIISNRAFDGKKIILTGAMIPLANGTDSDGYKNLAFILRKLNERNWGHGFGRVNIVLCDYDRHHHWMPTIKDYKPGRYEKFYAPDRRYSRLVEISQNA